MWVFSACSPAPTHDVKPPVSATSGGIDSYVMHRDDASGLPTFLRLSPRGDETPSKDAADAARRVLERLRVEYRLSDAAMKTVQLKSVHDLGRGAILVRFEQQVDGLDVFGRAVTVALDQKRRPIAASGTFAPKVQRLAADFARPQSDAVEAALSHMIKGSTPLGEIKAGGQKGRYTSFTAGPIALGEHRYTLAMPARVKQVLYPQPQGLTPAYYVETTLRQDSPSEPRLSSFVISAADGSVLHEAELTHGAANSYRVWADARGTPLPDAFGTAFLPHPTGMPDGSGPTTTLPSILVTMDHLPFSKNDPWLLAGATEARGNNVWAFADLVSPRGFNTGDLSLLPSSAGVFDYPLDPDADARSSDSLRRAGSTQMFYTLNYMHDLFYDAGFDEQSGNAQQDNFGRGGLGGDPIIGETQSYYLPNNVSTTTPADGASPQIAFGLCTGPRQTRVLAPTDIAGSYTSAGATFGPLWFGVSGDLVIVDDGVAGGTVTDGCEVPFVNAAAVANNIAVIDRGGGCTFLAKVKNAQAAGAVGVLIADNAPGAPVTMTGADPSVTIPSVRVSQADGALIEAKLTGGTAVQLSMAVPAVDCAVDNAFIIHEFAHVMNKRLVRELASSQASALHEGWADFVTLLTLVGSDAAAVSSNAGWNGTFALAPINGRVAQSNGYYYGPRRYPYSRDLAKNPLTYKYISNGVALPATPTPQFGGTGTGNASPNNAGEVWASMLWECYTNMLLASNRYTFDQAQKTMREYLVASLKLTPQNPTLLEARDALLATMYAASQEDFQECAASFAKRGAGVGAVSPGRLDLTNAGAVESSILGPDLAMTSIKLDDSAESCDNDGIVDKRETGRLQVTVRNTGTAPVTAATLTITADVPIVSLKNGGTFSLPALAPYASTSVVQDFTIRDATTSFAPTLTLKLESSSLAVPRVITQDIKRRMNYDVALTASTDDFAVKSRAWTISGDPQFGDVSTPWTQLTDEVGSGSFSIAEYGLPSDQYLISPKINVGTGNFGLAFKHRYSLEASSTQNFDGGVVEISEDDGQTWTDIGGMLTTGGYNGSLNAPTTGNPLIDPANPMDRPAFVNQSAGYPSFIDTVAEFGTTYAGKTVQVRFRFTTDTANAGGGEVVGWEIDSIDITGAAAPPFPQEVPQVLECNRSPVVTVTPVEQNAKTGDMVTFTGMVSDPDDDPVTYMWTQQSGPQIDIADPTALTQTFTAPPVAEPAEAVFALAASDGKLQTEVLTKVTLSGDPSPPPEQGCGCRTAPTPLGGATGLCYFMWIALAGYYCRRRIC